MTPTSKGTPGGPDPAGAAVAVGRFLRGLLIAALAGIGACTATVIPAGPERMAPALAGESLLVRDGAALPLHSWLPGDGEAAAVILALHGFNDYGRFFAKPGTWLATRGIAAYAYDQRGFGGAPNPGIWPGTATLVGDLRDAVAAVRARHPATPLFVLGESMGGAVAIVAATGPAGLDADGLILAAPAVRGRETMPWYQNAALWVSSRIAPSMTLSGRGLGVKPSDNVEMLRALGRDPLVIKETRIDAIQGLVNLMDAAQASAPQLRGPVLILLGGRDELVPDVAMCRFLSRLGYDNTGVRRTALYPDAYHMLLRDLDAERVWADVAAWIGNPAAPLPSHAPAPELARRPGRLAWTACGQTP